MEVVTTIELPEILSAEKNQGVFKAFEALAAGHALALVMDNLSTAQPLLGEFQDRCGEGFEWWPFQWPGRKSRVLISRYTGSTPRTMSDFLGADHHRLTALWNGFVRTERTCAMGHETMYTLDPHHLDGAKDDLAQFIYGLRRHIRMEEECFFPLFESKPNAPAGPTNVMRAEHREIRAALSILEGVLDLQNCAVLVETVESQPKHPTKLITEHDQKEERVLYPMADRILTPEEIRGLIKKMQAL